MTTKAKAEIERTLRVGRVEIEREERQRSFQMTLLN